MKMLNANQIDSPVSDLVKLESSQIIDVALAPDFFISHSTLDQAVARRVQNYLHSNGTRAFLAPFSIEPGAKWGEQILSNLRKARTVLFLASRAACASPYVNQELGGSLLLNKKIIPIVWNIEPEELPGWTKELEILDLRHGIANLNNLLAPIVSKAQQEKSREKMAMLIVFGLIIWLCARK